MIILTAQQAASLKAEWPYIDPRPLKDGRWALPEWVGGSVEFLTADCPREGVADDQWVEKPEQGWHGPCSAPGVG